MVVLHIVDFVGLGGAGFIRRHTDMYPTVRQQALGTWYMPPVFLLFSWL
jgi:hypothetical protein